MDSVISLRFQTRPQSILSMFTWSFAASCVISACIFLSRSVTFLSGEDLSPEGLPRQPWQRSSAHRVHLQLLWQIAEIRVQLCNITVCSAGLRYNCLKLGRARRHLGFQGPLSSHWLWPTRHRKMICGWSPTKPLSATCSVIKSVLSSFTWANGCSPALASDCNLSIESVIKSVTNSFALENGFSTALACDEACGLQPVNRVRDYFLHFGKQVAHQHPLRNSRQR